MPKSQFCELYRSRSLAWGRSGIDWCDLIRCSAHCYGGHSPLDETREHWQQSAAMYGRSLEATTKTWTAKRLELDALVRRFTLILDGTDRAGAVLEAGCGNGVNCLELASTFPNLSVDGVDYIPAMVAAAEQNRAAAAHGDQVRFFVGDVLHMDDVQELRPEYDIVFTDRCLINLGSVEEQQLGISSLAAKVKPGGHLVMIENSAATYASQNLLRTVLGLEPRTPAPFNLFFDEAEILAHILSLDLKVIEIEDFMSLHDLVLYVLVPAGNGGEIDYGHQMVQTATTLSQAASAAARSPFGAVGQNRLYCCQKLSNGNEGKTQ